MGNWGKPSYGNILLRSWPLALASGLPILAYQFSGRLRKPSVPERLMSYLGAVGPFSGCVYSFRLRLLFPHFVRSFAPIVATDCACRGGRSFRRT